VVTTCRKSGSYASPPVLVSIVIPVYNEESTIGPVLDVLAGLALAKEVIVVNDGSFDGTVEVLTSHASRPRVDHLERNSGKGAAIRRGMALATGDIVVVQDADLELSPSAILSLVDPIVRDEADAVYGSRFIREGHRVPWLRRVANRLLTGLTNLLHGTDLGDVGTAHKAIRRSTLEQVELTSSGFEIEFELTIKLHRVGARFVEVPSPYSPRTVAEGKKIRWTDGIREVRTIVGLRLHR
jgi:dolichol-phosphate mannosyltransferase